MPRVVSNVADRVLPHITRLMEAVAHRVGPKLALVAFAALTPVVLVFTAPAAAAVWRHPAGEVIGWFLYSLPVAAFPVALLVGVLAQEMRVTTLARVGTWVSGVTPLFILALVGGLFNPIAALITVAWGLPWLLGTAPVVFAPLRTPRAVDLLIGATVLGVTIVIASIHVYLSLNVAVNHGSASSRAVAMESCAAYLLSTFASALWLMSGIVRPGWKAEEAAAARAFSDRVDEAYARDEVTREEREAFRERLDAHVRAAKHAAVDAWRARYLASTSRACLSLGLALVALAGLTVMAVGGTVDTCPPGSPDPGCNTTHRAVALFTTFGFLVPMMLTTSIQLLVVAAIAELIAADRRDAQAAAMSAHALNELSEELLERRRARARAPTGRTRSMP